MGLDSLYNNDLNEILLRIENIETSQSTLVSLIKNKSELITNIVTILIALIASFLALYQIKLNTISSARIKWIQDLRLTVSEFITLVADLTVHLKNMIDRATDQGDGYKTAYKEDYKEYFRLSTQLKTKGVLIKLFLNDSENKHTKIKEFIDKIESIIHEKGIGDLDTSEIKQLLDKFRITISEILSEEWKKSKKIWQR